MYLFVGDSAQPPSADPTVACQPSQLKCGKAPSSKLDQKTPGNQTTSLLNAAICLLPSLLVPAPSAGEPIGTLTTEASESVVEVPNTAPQGSGQPGNGVASGANRSLSGLAPESNDTGPLLSDLGTSSSCKLETPSGRPLNVPPTPQPQETQEDADADHTSSPTISSSSPTAPANAGEEQAVEQNDDTGTRVEPPQTRSSSGAGTRDQASETAAMAAPSPVMTDTSAATVASIVLERKVATSALPNVAPPPEVSSKISIKSPEAEDSPARNNLDSGRSVSSESSVPERLNAIRDIPEVLNEEKPVVFATVRASLPAGASFASPPDALPNASCSSRATPKPMSQPIAVPLPAAASPDNVSSAPLPMNVARTEVGTSAVKPRLASTSGNVTPIGTSTNQPDPSDSQDIDPNPPEHKQLGFDSGNANPATTVTSMVAGSLADQNTHFGTSSAVATTKATATDSSSAPDLGGGSRVPVQSPMRIISGSAQMAQMTSKAAQSEMRIGLSTAEFGKVQVRTVIHASEVGVQIGSEKGDLRNLIANDLPGIANTLQQQNLRLAHVSFQQQGSASSADSSSSGGNPPPRSFAQRTKTLDDRGTDISTSEPAGASDLRSAGRRTLSILA